MTESLKAVNTAVPGRAAAQNTGAAGISLPAVPLKQLKEQAPEEAALLTTYAARTSFPIQAREQPASRETPAPFQLKAHNTAAPDNGRSSIKSTWQSLQQQKKAPSTASMNNPVNVIQRAKYTVGKRTYETENFNGGRERTKSVEGPVGHHNTGGRGGAPKSIALRNPADGSIAALPGYDGGHVLGLQLGGEDVNYNVVPMLPKFNRDTWRNVETELDSNALFAYSGQNFRVAITVDYPTAIAAIPSSLSVVAHADIPEMRKRRGKKPVPTGKVEKKEVYSATKSQPADIVPTDPANAATRATMMGTKANAVNAWKDGMRARPGYAADDFIKAIVAAGHLPQSRAREYPDSAANRPNGYMDVLVLSNQLFSDANFGAGRDFSSNQRTLLLQYNMARNGGALRSDDPADPHQVLSERGSTNFPEIDHIIPKSMGGSNFFSNARVVSWQLNNRDDRVKDITPLIGMDRIAFPTITGAEDDNDLRIKGKFLLKKHAQVTGKTAYTRDEIAAAVMERANLADRKAREVTALLIAAMLADASLVNNGGGNYTVA